MACDYQKSDKDWTKKGLYYKWLMKTMVLDHQDGL